MRTGNSSTCPHKHSLLVLIIIILGTSTFHYQAGTWGSSQGAMLESLTKTSCEIIEFGWTKDKAPVDTFIIGLTTSVRERNDYEEQVSTQL